MAEHFVCDRTELDDSHRKVINLDGKDIVVFVHAAKLYALSNVCLHSGGPVGLGNLMPKVEAELDEGKRWVRDVFDEDEIHIACPWHGYEYCIDTGELVTDRRYKLPTYEAFEEHGKVYVRV